MLPLRDRNPTIRTPWVTIGLIAANVLIFLLWQPTFGEPERQAAFYSCHGLVPWEVTNRQNLAQGGAPARQAIDRSIGSVDGAAIQDALRIACPTKSWWLPLGVSMFLHAGWIHLLGNLLFLWVFGNNVEDRLGRARYLFFYLLGGLVAAGLQVVITPESTAPTIGASGAIGAVLGAYLVLFPRHRILTLIFVFALVEIPAVFVLGSWFVLQLFSGVSVIGSELTSGVAYWAHVGGFLAGVAMTYVLLGRGARDDASALPPRPDAP
ncbi:MAG: rhomboid family intramembrane serine protease [Actinomycetota bacterium]